MKTTAGLVVLAAYVVGLGITNVCFGGLALMYAFKERLFSTPTPRQSLELDRMSRTVSYGRAW